MSTVGDGYGSQYHLRRWVNGNQSSLNAHIENAYRTLNLPPIDSIRWVSPMETLPLAVLFEPAFLGFQGAVLLTRLAGGGDPQVAYGPFGC